MDRVVVTGDKDTTVREWFTSVGWAVREVGI